MISYLPRYLMIVLASATLTLGTLHQHQLDTDYIAIFFNSLGVYLVYNRYQVLEKKHPLTLKISYFILFLISCITGYYYINSLLNLLLVGIIAGFGLLYTNTIPLVHKSLRDITGLKLFLVITSWFYVIIFLPIQNNNLTIHVKEIDLFTCIMIFVVGFAFDIRDRDIDPPTRKTLPQLIGKNASIVLVYLALSISIFVIHKPNTIQGFLYATSILINIICVAYQKFHKNPLYGTMLEFSLVLWGIGMYLE